MPAPATTVVMVITPSSDVEDDEEDEEGDGDEEETAELVAADDEGNNDVATVRGAAEETGATLETAAELAIRALVEDVAADVAMGATATPLLETTEDDGTAEATLLVLEVSLVALESTPGACRMTSLACATTIVARRKDGKNHIFLVIQLRC